MNEPPVALITGGAKRIGAAIARRLHAGGYNVIVHCHRSVDEAKRLCDELNDQRPDSAQTFSQDLVTDLNPAEFIAGSLVFWQRLDLLVNNASSFFPTPFGDITADHWEDLVGSNLKAPLFLTQAAAPELRRTGGSIINIVDIHANRPLKGYPLYSIAKAGLVALTRATARELGPDVRCNGIAPGAILWPEEPHYTAEHQAVIDRTVLKRPGEPTDIAESVWFLARQAPYITGQIITVDGGRTLRN